MKKLAPLTKSAFSQRIKLANWFFVSNRQMKGDSWIKVLCGPPLAPQELSSYGRLPSETSVFGIASATPRKTTTIG